MLELLNSDMSPIVDFVDVGDVSAPTDVPLVLRNTGAGPVMVDGSVLAVPGSDGFERLRFAVAEPPTPRVGAFFIPPSAGIAIGDVFDVGVVYNSWVAGFSYATVLRSRAAVCAATGTPIDVAADNMRGGSRTVYLRRTADAQWFTAMGSLVGHVSAVTPVTPPTVVWGSGNWWGYGAIERSQNPLPNWAPVLLAGQAVPVLLRIGVTGGSATQNVFRLNPRKAAVDAVGMEVL